MEQIALPFFRRQRKHRDFVVIVILGREPEENCHGDAARFVITFELQQRGDFRERVKRTAREADLLSGDDRDALAARPSLDVVTNEEPPSLIGFDERVYQLGRCVR